MVHDAIVVIENIARHIEMNRGKKTPLESAAEAMAEIQSAVVASSLVLLAVFIPVGFFPGATGQLYKQLALTIAAAITISLFQALTLAPVLSSRLLGEESEARFIFFRWFNHGLKRFRDWYSRQLPKAFRYRWIVAGVFGLALALTGFLFVSTPQSFIPDEDQGYFIVLLHHPKERRSKPNIIARKAEAIILQQPEVEHLFDVGGFSFSGAAPNRGIMFALLKPWGDRKCSLLSQLLLQPCTHNVAAVLQRLNGIFYMQVPQARNLGFNPPAINGVGTVGGFQFELEDRGNVGLDKLMGLTYAMMGAAAKDPRLTGVFTQFRVKLAASSGQRQPEQSQGDRHFAQRHLPDDGGAAGIALRQNFHVPQPLVAGQRSGRRAVPQRYRVPAADLRALGLGGAKHPHRIESVCDASTRIGHDADYCDRRRMTPLSALMNVSMQLGSPVIRTTTLPGTSSYQGGAAPGHTWAKPSPRWNRSRSAYCPTACRTNGPASSSTKSRPARWRLSFLRLASSSCSWCCRHSTKASSIRSSCFWRFRRHCLVRWAS